MKKNLILSLVTAAVMPLSLCSCESTTTTSTTTEFNFEISTYSDDEDYSEDYDENEGYSEDYDENYGEDGIDYEEYDDYSRYGDYEDDEQDYQYERVDIDSFNEWAYKLLDDVEISNNKENVQNDIDRLLSYMDTASELSSYASVAFNYDWQNEYLKERYDIINEDFSAVNAGLTYTFCNAALAEEYADLFTELIFDDEESNALYTARNNSLRRAEEYAKVDYRLAGESTDKYNEIIHDESLSDDEKNLQCAEVYIDILSNCDPDTFYDMYYRDFTPEEAAKTSEIIIKELIPANNELMKLYNVLDADDRLINIKGVENPFGVIQKYAPQLSDGIKEKIDMLIDDGLYLLGNFEQSMDTGFTMCLPYTQRAVIYNMIYDNYRDLTDCVHEFGHFYATCQNTIPAYLQISNTDVAEIQSQALEIIFTRFYDDIYGEDADLVRVAVISNMIDTIISSFAVGEFEYEMVKNIDNLKPQDIVDKFDEIVNSVCPGSCFYQISHLFNQPGYYVSYGVSALAAFNIFDENIDNPELAVEKYEKIAAISAYSPECRFRESLKQSGFDDIFTEEYIRNLAARITQYAEDLKKNSK